MSEVYFVDTTLRDGNQSLWALLMKTGMALPVARQIGEMGFRAVDLTAPAHFKTIVRELHEDPWERIRLVAERIPQTPLGVMQHCTITGFGVTPLCLLRLWMERLAANGIRRLHLMEASNDMGLRVPEIVRFAKEVGLEVLLALTYSLSPKHTDEYYAQKARDAANLKVDAISLKDPGGLLTPERIRTLVPVIFQNVNGIPIELHSHCTTGLAPLCYLEAMQLGVKTFHTAIPPLANSSSQPSVVNIAKNARFLGFTPTIDEEATRPITEHFEFVAKREGFPIGAPLEYDYYQYVHQVPGGVISNLKRQLAQIRMEDRLQEVIEESIRVRQDLGYPIMVTPFSQYVATQAAINVILGERYKQVTDEVIHYTLGLWGQDAAAAVDRDVADKILSSARAKELSRWEPPEPSLDEVRRELGGPGVSDDELLLRFIMGDVEAIKAMRAAGPIKEYPSAGNNLLLLIQELTKRDDTHYIYIQKGELSFAIQK